MASNSSEEGAMRWRQEMNAELVTMPFSHILLLHWYFKIGKAFELGEHLWLGSFPSGLNDALNDYNGGVN